MPERPGIYFMRCGRFIKIGYSLEPSQRCATIQSCNPVPVVLVGVECVSQVSWFRREQDLHAQFAALHVRGEWFRAEEPLLSYVRTHAAHI